MGIASGTDAPVDVDTCSDPASSHGFELETISMPLMAKKDKKKRKKRGAASQNTSDIVNAHAEDGEEFEDPLSSLIATPPALPGCQDMCASDSMAASVETKVEH